ncbi:MAG: hypothetical protein HZC44_04615 [Geobacter sp.]|nr:hypothetical protein [Geobacter sp.]
MLITEDTTTGIQSYANIAGHFPLTGDFDITINWREPIAPASGDWSSTFQINSVDQNMVPDNHLVGNALQIKRAYINGVGHSFYTGRFDGSGWVAWSNPVITSDIAGRFRIKRSGSTVTVWYWNTSLSRWEWNGTTAGYAWTNVWTSPCYVQIGVPNNIPYKPAVKTEWNNFEVDLSGRYPDSGTIRLKQDAGRITTWQNLTWNTTVPLGTSLQFRTRSAADESGLASATWSDYLTISGSPIASPPGRWIEVEATLATTDTNSTPLLHDVTVTYGNSPGDIVWQTDVPVDLAQGGVADPNNAIGTIGWAGKYYLQGTLTSNTGQPIAEAEYPFYGEQGTTELRLATDRKIYRPGDTVTIQGEVRNLSDIAATGLVLQVRDVGHGGGTLYSETFDVPAAENHPFSFTTIAGNDGTYGLIGVVTQNTATLAEIADQYATASLLLSATLTAPDTAGNDPFTVTVTLNNTGTVNATTVVRITDDSGAVIDNQEVTIPAGETRLLQYTQRITAATTYTLLVSGDLNQAMTKSVLYTALYTDSVNVGTKVVTDRISYNPNEQATISSTVTNQNAFTLIDNLSARITVVNSQGQALYSTTASLPLLNQGQQATLNTPWNTGTNPPGTYLVTLQVLNYAGTGISTAVCNLVVNDTSVPTALLQGAISVDTQSILTGEPVTISYGVTNAGNTDLTDIALSVQTDNLSDLTVYNTITGLASLSIGTIPTGSSRIGTQGYSAKDYLVVLRASINGVEETLSGTYFRVEGAPSATALAAPANGDDVGTFSPQLSINNASDPNDDALTYDFELFTDSGLTNRIAQGTLPETTGITSWTVPAALTENQPYY